MQSLLLNVYSLIILGLLLFISSSRRNRSMLPNRLFSWLIAVDMLLILSDIVGWLVDGKPGVAAFLLYRFFIFLLFSLEPIAAMLWTMYADFQIHHDRSHWKKIRSVILSTICLNTVLTLTSFLNGWFFSIDGDNVYRRGPYYMLHIVLGYFLVAYTLGYILVNRSKLEKRYFTTLMLYPLPQVLGGLIQVLHYGLSLAGSGMSLSLLSTYFGIQSAAMDIDYLTGVYNRRLLDHYIVGRIKQSDEHRSFSAILIDINQFKQINDTYGHDEGDSVLQTAAGLIRGSLRSNDFVARFGGDEFYILLDVDNIGGVKTAIDRITARIDDYNRDNPKPWKISFSIGYDVYDRKLWPNAESFLKHIDGLMYQDKKRFAAQREGAALV